MTAVLLIALAPLFSADADAAKAEGKKLQGEWKVVSMEIEGNEIPAEAVEKIAVKIEGDKFIIANPDDKEHSAKFTLDPTKSPKQIDATPNDGPQKDKTALGVYELDGDMFKLAIAQPDQERPGSVGGNAGVIYLVLKRK